MTQAIEENTKALNRLTNTLLGIFKIVQAGVEGATSPVAASKPATAPASAAPATKTQPAPAKPAAEPVPDVLTRPQIGALVIKYAATGGRDKAVALMAEYKDAKGEPAKSVSKGDSTVQDADLPALGAKLIELLGAAVVTETLKALATAK